MTNPSIPSDLIERLAQKPGDYECGTYRALSAGEASPEQQRAAAAGIVLSCALEARAKEALSQLTREVDAYREALTASGETKAEYIGEFSFDLPVGFDRHGNDLHRSFDVPWTTIKEIMAAIRKRALSRSSGGAQ